MAGMDSYVKLLLHCDGTDASTTFLDSVRKTVTAVGNAQIDTAQSKFGGASALFDGAGDALSIPTHADFQLGGSNDPFTIDAWVKTTDTIFAICGFGGGTDAWNGTTGNQYMFYYYTDTLYIDLWNGSGTNSASYASALPKNGDWHHLTVSYDGTTTRLAIDGTFGGSTTTGTYANTTTPTVFKIGTTAAATLDLNGWLDELRVSKGIARWTANFTPPTSAYSVDQSIDGNLSLSGSIGKAITKTITGISTFAGVVGTVFTHTGANFTRAVAGVITFTGAFLNKAITKTVVGSLVLTGIITKLGTFKRTVTGALVLTATLTKIAEFKRTLTGAITFSGSILKNIAIGIYGEIRFIGNIFRGFALTLSGTLRMNGWVRRWGWNRLQRDTETWSAVAKDSESWSADSKDSEIWTPDTKDTETWT